MVDQEVLVSGRAFLRVVAARCPPLPLPAPLRLPERASARTARSIVNIRRRALDENFSTTPHHPRAPVLFRHHHHHPKQSSVLREHVRPTATFKHCRHHPKRPSVRRRHFDRLLFLSITVTIPHSSPFRINIFEHLEQAFPSSSQATFRSSSTPPIVC